MIKAPTIAEKRPVYHLVIATNSGFYRVRLTNTRRPPASSFQALVIRLSYLSNVFIYVSHTTSHGFPWAVVEVIEMLSKYTQHSRRTTGAHPTLRLRGG